MLNALDLYAKIEPLIGFYDEYEQLYSSYLYLMQPLEIQTVLDVGCGNGKLAKLLLENGYDVLGIDRSEAMIERAKSLGINAQNIELSSLPSESFDSLLCVGDVLNYMKQDELKRFMIEVSRVLKKGGYLLADINTLHGFEISDGSVIKDQTDKFLAIDASFEDDILRTEMTYFEKENAHYQKYSNIIYQYYHPHDIFTKCATLTLLRTVNITMFSDESDKNLLILQKAT
ncbi:class I SAM-dependent methyltransferase [Sulfurospirillum sp. 1612]|uniref:class I SAM-dependent methyltransferase n=1 Tax=Sulfurospirillum sp. 1612 TaxID=3094835 RepID=UPI002F959863